MKTKLAVLFCNKKNYVIDTNRSLVINLAGGNGKVLVRNDKEGD